MKRAAKSWTLACAGALTAAVMALTPAANAQPAPNAQPAASVQPAANAQPAASAANAGAAPVGPPEAAKSDVANGEPAKAAAPAQAPSEGEAQAPAQGGTPLSLRPAPTPLGAATGGSGSWSTQVGLVVLALAGGVWLWKRRAKGAAEAKKPPKILSRTSVGVRSELLVVEVEGQTMLLGVTPTSIQRIAILTPADGGAPMEMAEADASPEPGFQGMMQRAASSMRDVDEPAAAPSPQVSRPVGVAHTAKSASALRALTPPTGNVPVKVKSAKGGGDGEGFPRSNTLRGLGMGDVEEQARGLLEARGRQ